MSFLLRLCFLLGTVLSKLLDESQNSLYWSEQAIYRLAWKNHSTLKWMLISENQTQHVSGSHDAPLMSCVFMKQLLWKACFCFMKQVYNHEKFHCSKYLFICKLRGSDCVSFKWSEGRISFLKTRKEHHIKFSTGFHQVLHTEKRYTKKKKYFYCLVVGPNIRR